jgi:hypothetical protein
VSSQARLQAGCCSRAPEQIVRQRALLFQASSHRRTSGELDHVDFVLSGRGVRVAVDVKGARIPEGDVAAERGSGAAASPVAGVGAGRAAGGEIADCCSGDLNFRDSEHWSAEHKQLRTEGVGAGSDSGRGARAGDAEQNRLAFRVGENEIDGAVAIETEVDAAGWRGACWRGSRRTRFVRLRSRSCRTSSGRIRWLEFPRRH